MRTDKFHLTIYAIVGLFVVAIIVLSVALLNNGPRVRLVQFENDPTETTLTTDSNITVSFDRPIEKKDYTDQISFTPEVSFTTRTNAQNIVIRLDNSFDHNTEYELNISDGIYDQTGRQMQEPYMYEFMTAGARFAYLERNYGVNLEESLFSDTEASDHIKIGDFEGNSEIIFSYPEIRSFAISEKYLVVVGYGEVEDRIFVKNLETGDVREEEQPLKRHVHNITLSPRGNVALFSVEPEFTKNDLDYYNNNANLLYALDLEQGGYEPQIDSSRNFIRAVNIDIDNSGQIALIKSPSDGYFAISPYNEYDPILVGSYNSTFGFLDNSKIIFRTTNETVIQDVNTGDVAPVSVEGSRLIRWASPSNNQLYVLSIDYSSGVQDAKVIKVSEDNSKEADVVWTKDASETYSLTKITASNDSNVLAFQTNPLGCSYDNIKSDNQCKEVETIIYDLKTNEEVERFNGFNLVWLP